MTVDAKLQEVADILKQLPERHQEGLLDAFLEIVRHCLNVYRARLEKNPEAS